MNTTGILAVEASGVVLKSDSWTPLIVATVIGIAAGLIVDAVFHWWYGVVSFSIFVVALGLLASLIGLMIYEDNTPSPVDTNLANIESYYSVSDIKFTKASKGHDVTGTMSVPVPMGNGTVSMMLETTTTTVGASDGGASEIVPHDDSRPASYPISFKDSKGARKTGYLTVKGDRATLYTNSDKIVEHSHK